MIIQLGACLSNISKYRVLRLIVAHESELPYTILHREGAFVPAFPDATLFYGKISEWVAVAEHFPGCKVRSLARRRRRRQGSRIALHDDDGNDVTDNTKRERAPRRAVLFASFFSAFLPFFGGIYFVDPYCVHH